MADLPTATMPRPCSVEIFRRSIPGNMTVSYWVRELPTADVPDPNPLDIIAWDQEYQIYVVITIPDPVRRHLCGRLCVDIDVDTCGPSRDLGFPEKEVELDPCGNGVYTILFPLPAGTFAPPTTDPNRCGRVYRICVTVGSHDLCGGPGLIWGHCDSVEIAVHPPVPVP